MQENTPLLPASPDTASILLSKAWLKLDIRLMSLMTIMLFLSFLDRGNIGNAIVVGMKEDLELTDPQYSMVLTVSWIPYILSMMPSSLLLEKIGANFLFSGMVVGWGFATVMQGFCRSFLELALCRFLLGIFTGGLIPCLTLYLTSFYPRHFLQLRLSTFFATAALAGAFSGFLAAGISRLGGVLGASGWAWIFFIEGGFTIFIGGLCFRLVPQSLEDTTFLSLEEKRACAEILIEQGMIDSTPDKTELTWKEFLHASTSLQVIIISMACFFGGAIDFEPVIIQGLGYHSTKAQLMSVPPFGVAFVCALISGFVSDRYQCRGLISATFAGLCGPGFFNFLVTCSIPLVSENITIRYASFFLSLPGAFCAAPALGAWIANNIAPSKRPNITSCLGGIIAVWILGTFSSAPRNTLAAACFTIFSILQTICSLINLRYVILANRRKSQ
ncbi:MFS general substrate transporter [Pholiota molesta]|nr:MFS general substrate transporter [Pholiota molesta]